MENFAVIQKLLDEKNNIESELSKIPFKGVPEIRENKSGKYLYTKYRELGKSKTSYIGLYTDELYKQLKEKSIEAKELRKKLKKVEKELGEYGYSSNELPLDLRLNIDYARANMKNSIYDQAILEGVGTTYSETETIIENGKVYNMKASDIQKILNLKHAWDFILDKDVIQAKSDLSVLSYIAKLVNEGFYMEGGTLRIGPVRIGGCNYIPPIPNEINVKDAIEKIINSEETIIDKTIDLCLYCMKAQLFNDGNKRAAIIFANHYLVAHMGGLLVVPFNKTEEFKKLLVDYYDNNKYEEIKTFLKNNCWQKFK